MACYCNKFFLFIGEGMEERLSKGEEQDLTYQDLCKIWETEKAYKESPFSEVMNCFKTLLSSNLLKNCSAADEAVVSKADYLLEKQMKQKQFQHILNDLQKLIHKRK
jgi:hypothetical protein